MQHHAPNPEHLALTRREFLNRCGMGMGALGLGSLMGNLGFTNSAAADGFTSPLMPPPILPAEDVAVTQSSAACFSLFFAAASS